MGERVIEALKSCGQGVIVHSLAKIVKPEMIEIGDHSRMDDFTFINKWLRWYQNRKILLHS